MPLSKAARKVTAIRTFADDVERVRDEKHLAKPDSNVTKATPLAPTPPPPKPVPEPAPVEFDSIPEAEPKPLATPEPKPMVTEELPEVDSTPRPVIDPASQQPEPEPISLEDDDILEAPPFHSIRASSPQDTAYVNGKLAKSQRQITVDTSHIPHAHPSDADPVFDTEEAMSSGTEGTIVTDRKENQFRLFPAILSSIGSWFASKKSELKQARKPKHTITKSTQRKDVIAAAAQKTNLAPTDDYEQVTDRLQAKPRVNVAEEMQIKEKSVAEPQWQYIAKPEEEGVLPSASDEAITTLEAQLSETNISPDKTETVEEIFDTKETPDLPSSVVAQDSDEVEDPFAKLSSALDTPDDTLEQTDLPETPTESVVPHTPLAAVETEAVSEAAPMDWTHRTDDVAQTESGVESTTLDGLLPDQELVESDPISKPEPVAEPEPTTPPTITPESPSTTTLISESAEQPFSSPQDLDTPDIAKPTPVEPQTSPLISTGLPRPDRDIPAFVRESVGQPVERSSSTNRTVALVGVIVIAVVLGVGSTVWWFTRDSGEIADTIPAATTLVTANAAIPAALGSDRTEFYTQLRGIISRNQGSLIALYPTIDDVPATAEQVLTAMRLQAPGGFVRGITNITFGGFNGDAPFIVMRFTNFDVAFGGILAWEPFMTTDLAPLFGEPVAVSSIDSRINNRSIRVLVDALGNDRIVYGIIDSTTILITTSRAAFSSIAPRVQQ